MKTLVRNTLARAVLVVVALVARTGLPITTTSVYSNFPVDPAGGGYMLDDSQSYLGASFSPSQATILDHVVVPLFFQAPNLSHAPGADSQASLQVLLYGSDGNLPGNLLANLGTITAFSNSPPANNLYATPSSASAGVALDPSQTYWLVLENLSPTGSGVSWALNGSGADGFAVSADGNDWMKGNPGNGLDTSPAFEVLGVSIPEPSAPLIGAFLAVLFPLRRIRSLRSRKLSKSGV